MLGLQRSIVVDRMVDALGRATFSQDELIARWKQARVDIQAQTEAMRRALDASLSQEDPTAALAEARRARDLVRQVVQLPRQAFSVNFFLDVFRDKLYMKALFNSLSLGVATVITTSIVGFTVAYLLVRYDFPLRKAFNFLTIVPIVMPPLVGVLGFIFILGRGEPSTSCSTFWPRGSSRHGPPWPTGSSTGCRSTSCRLARSASGGDVSPVPLITLNVLDSLSKIDASLEEAAESMGSVGLKRLFDITIPLTVPGFVTGALLVFVWAFADFAAPMVVGLNTFIAPLAYMDIQQFTDRRLFKMGITVGAVMVALSIIFLLLAKKYISMKDYSTLSYRPVERKPLKGKWHGLAVAFLVVLLLLSFIPYVGVGLASFAGKWSLSPLPTSWTLDTTRRCCYAPGYIITRSSSVLSPWRCAYSSASPSRGSWPERGCGAVGSLTS